MSYIRPSGGPCFSKGTQGMYAYPTTIKGVEYVQMYPAVNAEEFCEVMWRVLVRAGLKPTLKLLNEVRAELYLKPFKELPEGAMDKWLQFNGTKKQRLESSKRELGMLK